MSRGILKSALTTTIRLDLSYRELSSPRAAEAPAELSLTNGPELQRIAAEHYDALLRMRWIFAGDTQ